MKPRSTHTSLETLHQYWENTPCIRARSSLAAFPRSSRAASTSVMGGIPCIRQRVEGIIIGESPFVRGKA